MLALTVSRRKTYKNLRQCTNGEGGGGDIFVLLSEILSAAFNLNFDLKNNRDPGHGHEEL